MTKHNAVVMKIILTAWNKNNKNTRRILVLWCLLLVMHCYRNLRFTHVSHHTTDTVQYTLHSTQYTIKTIDIWDLTMNIIIYRRDLLSYLVLYNLVFVKMITAINW